MGEKWNKGLLGWIDARFPLSKSGRVLRTQELQLLVLLWFTRTAGAGYPDPDRRLADHELQAGCRHGV